MIKQLNKSSALTIERSRVKDVGNKLRTLIRVAEPIFLQTQTKNKYKPQKLRDPLTW